MANSFCEVLGSYPGGGWAASSSGAAIHVKWDARDLRELGDRALPVRLRPDTWLGPATVVRDSVLFLKALTTYKRKTNPPSTRERTW